MKKMLNLYGLTLVELIVASLLIAIVLMGVVAFNLSLKRIQDNSFNQSTLSLQASTAMDYLRSDISMAVGRGYQPPIIVGQEGPGVRSKNSGEALCLRQPDSTPMDLNDNGWVCYYYNISTKNLQRCNLLGNIPVGNISDSSCNTTAPNTILNIIKLQNGNFFNLFSAGPGLVRITLNAEDGSAYYSMSTDIATRSNPP